jgi:hypothetical protein
LRNAEEFETIKFAELLELLKITKYNRLTKVQLLKIAIENNSAFKVENRWYFKKKEMMEALEKGTLEYGCDI